MALGVAFQGELIRFTLHWCIARDEALVCFWTWLTFVFACLVVDAAPLAGGAD